MTKSLSVASLLSASVFVFILNGDDKSARHADEMFPVIGPDISIHVDEVKSIAPEKRAGFGKAWALYHVLASTPAMLYDVYCVQSAPASGETYIATDDYVDASLSALKLWPEERKNLNLPPGRSTKGRAYRVLIFKDVNKDPRLRPDIGCDVKTETARH